MNAPARFMSSVCVLVLLLPNAGIADPIEDPIPEPIGLSNVTVALEPVVEGLVAPNWAIAAPGVLSGRLFVGDQPGQIWSVSLISGQRFVFLDVADLLIPLGLGGPGTYDSRGLLGFAFHPQYATNGLLYTYTSQPPDKPATFPLPPDVTVSHHNVVTEWRVPEPSHPRAAVAPGSARELMRIPFPAFDHNGGCMNFGPDGLLYIAIGDGGGRDDEGPGHGEFGMAQDPSNPQGSILRIDPRRRDAPNGAYGIPPTNPFVGVPGFLPETFAYGFRNPWRFSFDAVTRLMFVADVGQGDVEEVSIVRSGGNYGWRWREGGFFFDPNGADDGFVTDDDPGAPPGLIDPLMQYDHDDGNAIVRGFVYRGRRIPALTGHYVFGEWALTAGNDGRLFAHAGHGVIRELRIAGQPNLGIALMGFGQDASGELYVLGNQMSLPWGESGSVERIVPAE
jgi:glucose/arabinose dehydrogenase